MNKPRNAHTGKSSNDKQYYLNRLKEPKKAELTLPDKEDSFTVPPSQNEINIKKNEVVEHRPYQRSKAKKKDELNLTKTIIEIGAAIILAAITYLTLTLNREVGEHGVKIDNVKEDITDMKSQMDKIDIKIDNVRNAIISQPVKP
jgi:hypothetical protein